MPNKPATPTLIDGLSLEEILVPRPVTYDYDGRPVSVYPMTERELIVVGDAFDIVLQAGSALGGLDALKELSASKFAQALMEQIPALLKGALPQVTLLIAGALRVTPEVAAQIPLVHKAGLLRAVIEAERVETLVKNVQGLGTVFAGLRAAAQPVSSAAETETEEEDIKTVDQIL